MWTRLIAIESRKADKTHRDTQPLLEDTDCAAPGLDTVITPSGTGDSPDPPTQPTPARTSAAEVTPLQHRVPQLQQRPLPSLQVYDQLLTTRRQKGSWA